MNALLNFSSLMILFVFAYLCTFHLTQAHNPLEGLLQDNSVCLNEQNFPECNSSIPDVFTPQNKAVDLNNMTTKYLLFTRRNPEEPEPLHKCGGRLPSNTTYDQLQHTVLISHGWIDGVCRTAWQREMKSQLLQRGDYNVILIDWTWGNFPDLVDAGANAKTVGEQTAFVINRIMEQTRMTGEMFHVIGHSFGTIVASFAGKYVPNLRRITSLDPPLPPYSNAPPSERLTKTDATFVDVIHSAKGFCYPVHFGDPRSLGHQDFFPNGGAIQSSCYSYILPGLLKGDVLYSVAALLWPPMCYHLHSIQYFKASINPGRDRFYAAKCSSYKQYKAGGCRCTRGRCAVMGMDSEKYYYRHGKVQGDFYVDTELICPYVKNKTKLNTNDIHCDS